MSTIIIIKSYWNCCALRQISFNYWLQSALSKKISNKTTDMYMLPSHSKESFYKYPLSLPIYDLISAFLRPPIAAVTADIIYEIEKETKSACKSDRQNFYDLLNVTDNLRPWIGEFFARAAKSKATDFYEGLTDCPVMFFARKWNLWFNNRELPKKWASSNFLFIRVPKTSSVCSIFNLACWLLTLLN